MYFGINTWINHRLLVRTSEYVPVQYQIHGGFEVSYFILAYFFDLLYIHAEHVVPQLHNVTSGVLSERALEQKNDPTE